MGIGKLLRAEKIAITHSVSFFNYGRIAPSVNTLSSLMQHSVPSQILKKPPFRETTKVSGFNTSNTANPSVASDIPKQNRRINLLRYMGSNIWEGNLSELRAMR